MNKAVFLLLIIIFNNYVFGQSKDSKLKIDGVNYSITYPSNWEADQSGHLGSTFMLFSPFESDHDFFRENVNLTIQDLSDCYNINLNQYVHIYEKLIKMIYQNGNILETHRIFCGHSECQSLVYSGDQGVYHLMFEQFFMIRDDKAYILTLTCEKDKFEKYKNTGEAIMDSFVFK